MITNREEKEERQRNLFWQHANVIMMIIRVSGRMSNVFANGDLGSVPGQVILKTQKMVLDAALIHIQYYKVRVKGKLEQIHRKEYRPK